MATNAKATQDFIPIREVRDGFLVLKDGSLRAVLMASSLNFALKSEDEQMAILMQFQHFLNSLDFTVQFMIHSRDLDIRPT
jgi:type IV secretory pathway VirB4 component